MRTVVAAELASFVGAAAPAAELYMQPQATLSAEYDTNLDLDPAGGGAGNEGYMVDAATLLGIMSPTSNTNIEPRIRYADYPRETALNRLQGMLDFNTSYMGQRSSFSAFGRFDHLNEIEAELPSAQYNPINPQAPTTPQTAQVNIGVTRNNFYLVPQYEYNITPLIAFGASATFQDLTYSVTNPNNLVNFNYEQGEVFVSRDLDPRTTLTLGAYGTRYEATSIDSHAQSGGATVDLRHNWSAVTRSELSVQYQHTMIDALQPTVFHGANNTVGATFSSLWRRQTSQFRLNIGRTVTPSGGGGLYVDDQVQGEYDHSFTERLSLTGALLYIRSRGLSANVNRFDQDYGQGLLSVKWMLTRTWFIQAGGSYTNLKRSLDGRADNDRAYLQFGYQGLPPR
jgi:hypothetical protein